MKQITKPLIEAAQMLEDVIDKSRVLQPGSMSPNYQSSGTLQKWVNEKRSDLLNLCADPDTRNLLESWIESANDPNTIIPDIAKIIAIYAIPNPPDFTPKQFPIYADPLRDITAILAAYSGTWNNARIKYECDLIEAGEDVAEVQAAADPKATNAAAIGAGSPGTQPNPAAIAAQLKSFEPDDYTDVGQSNIFSVLYHDKVKWSKGTNFLVYNGNVWQEDDKKAVGLSKELTEKQLVEAQDRVYKAQDILNQAVVNNPVTNPVDGDDEVSIAKKQVKHAEAYRAYVLGRRKEARINATLNLAIPDISVDVSELDGDGYLLNTPGGTVDLRTGIIRPHSPNDYCTKITTVSPDTVNADMFAEFLQRVTVGDKELEQYLQEIAGMCAVGKVLSENLIIAYGEGGNGKSTLFNLLAKVLGDYSGGLSAETMTTKPGKNKSPEYAELRGKRLVIAAELEEGTRLDTATLKKLCSTDPITAERKFKDPFTFIPTHTIILYTNNLPRVGTNDKGTWDRIIVIPFMANFRGQQGEIKNYADHLYNHCAGAVLTWIIEGAKRFIENDYKLKLPSCVESAITQYKDDNDWLSDFLSECCEMDRSYKQPSGELYTCYTKYCERTGDYHRRARDFSQALSRAGYQTIKTMKGAIVHGLRIKSEFDTPEQAEFDSMYQPNF